MELMCYNLGNKMQTDTGVRSTYTRSNHQQRKLRMATSNHTTSIPYGYCHCGCGQKTPIATSTDKRYGRVKGQPTQYISRHVYRATQVKRFWAKVAIKANDDECWEWLGSCDTHGYGNFFWNSKITVSSKIAWMYPNYVIPKGFEICHSCDNPACCNPKHLWLGTHQENMDDKMRKGRQGNIKQAVRRGEAHPNHKLTQSQVDHIRQLYTQGNITLKALGELYDVDISSIHAIIKRVTWK